MDMVAIALIKNLQEMDGDNEYFIFVNEIEDSTPIDPSPNFTIVPLPASPYPIWEQYHLAKVVHDYKLDLLHCTSNTAPLFCSTKLLITLHDIIYLEKLNFREGTWYQRLGNLYRRWIVPAVVKKASRLYTVSQYEKERIRRQFGLPDEQVKVIYNGVAGHFKRENKETIKNIRKKYHLPDRFILFLGNTDPKKNLKGVLKSLALLDKRQVDFPDLVMPDIGIEVLRSMLAAIGSPELIRKIHLTGYIPNTDLPAIYSEALLFLYPSLRESFGLPVLEAMACGCPVISSNTSSMPEVAGNAALLIDPFDPEDLSKGIENLLASEELRKTLTARGYERPPLFDYRKGAAETLKSYHQIAAK
ncbi:Glycosyltransferase involved in cell wall bisynthesis [Cyclobacterium lianum]|uniref:Glycosyltransferase involved in cell wall bisynthesis n=2 Tax=Cyclobacterium lianum TaxID=388280 RepID=A0A1M7PG19_9BACT|nr:Glycosyltransferase involved in cell wall bisynthesis [Cyclobacterium lianum]